MNLESILNHAAFILNVIMKSPQASDSFAEKYFRQKKYIGSKERKFISEAVFSFLRIKSLAEHLALKALSSSNISLPEETLLKEFLYLSTTCFIYPVISKSKPGFSPTAILADLYKTSNLQFDNLLAQAISVKIRISLEESMNFIDSLPKFFNELDFSVKATIKNYKISNQLLITDEDIENISIRYSVQPWILKGWLYNDFSKITLDKAALLCESLMYPASLCLRVNLPFDERNKVIVYFKENEIDAIESNISPAGLKINKRINLHLYDIYKSGVVDVQDEGSQLISFAAAPDKTDRILDACAGAGGKSLHLASIQGDKGEIISSDIEFLKLKELTHRARRSGFKSIKTVLMNENKKIDDAFRKPFDVVLIDAPCSGTGTSRRSPMLKWRLNMNLLKKLAAKQYKLLEYYSQFVKDGGYVVYSTCSLMTEENDFIVEKFLKEHSNFVPDSINIALEKNHIYIKGIKNEDFKLTLTPSEHGCDGFFMARLKRIEE